MRTIDELINVDEPALPPRSPLGAVVYETGGILVDGGWLRILGSGNARLTRTLPGWNAGHGEGCLKERVDAVVVPTFQSRSHGDCRWSFVMSDQGWHDSLAAVAPGRMGQWLTASTSTLPLAPGLVVAGTMHETFIPCRHRGEGRSGLPE